jgi:hypothetical protein
MSVMLLGEYASELQDACTLSQPIDEDNDFPKISSAIFLGAQESRLNLRRTQRMLAGHI